MKEVIIKVCLKAEILWNEELVAGLLAPGLFLDALGVPTSL